MKFIIVQMNPTVGDLAGNYDQHIKYIENAVGLGAEMVIFPEMSLTGYPLEDLVLRPSFMTAVESVTSKLIQWINNNYPHLGVIFGAPSFGSDGINNSAFYVEAGVEDIQIIDKYELPNYGVFDEKRVFKSGGEPYPINFKGYKIGVMICEDCWFPTVSKTLHENGAAMLISINGSPFEIGKNVTRRKVISNRINETGLPFMYVNTIGGQDELVFDGGSFYYDGHSMQEAPFFKEGLFEFNVDLEHSTSYINSNDDFIAEIDKEGYFVEWKESPDRISLDNYPMVETSGIKEIYQAIHLGLKDYMMKQKNTKGIPVFNSVVLGYSGGVDSGIVAAIACDAVGPENVHLVRLPSKYSSEGSLKDAWDGANRLGANLRTTYIEPVVEALREAYMPRIDVTREYGTDFNSGPLACSRELTGIADENIQARARGNILMAISNHEGHLLLTTGNKSEVSVGYSTLYGDMSGGYNPIKDAYKTTVWALCRWRNSLTQEELDELGFLGKATEVVPEAIISKPPSAELRPDQKDEDSLPPYPVLDSILKGMIEKEQSNNELIHEGFSSEQVIKIRNLVDNSEYKRRQAAPGVKITNKLYGRDRRYPIVNAWRD